MTDLSAGLSSNRDIRPKRLQANDLKWRIKHRSRALSSCRHFRERWVKSTALSRSVSLGSGPPRTMYATSAPAPYHSRYVSLAPFSLYASPGWDDALELTTLEGIVGRLRRASTRGLVWTVRFDHAALARGLLSFNMPFRQTATHVLALEHGYACAAAGYSATIRNEIRKAERRGVCVRDAGGEADVRAYYELHARLVQQKEWRGFRYPLALFLELIRLKDFVRLLLAEHEGRIVSGALLFRDADCVLYWHAATRPSVFASFRFTADTGRSDTLGL